MVMTMRNLTGGLLTIAALTMLSGCGIEGLFAEGFDKSHELPTVGLFGTTVMQDADFTVLLQDGTEVEPIEASIAGASFDLRLPLSCYQLTRVIASKGEQQMRVLIGRLSAEPPPSYACGSASGVHEALQGGVQIDAATSAAMLVVEARMSVEGRSLNSYDPKIVEGVLNLMYEEFAQPGTGQDFVTWVGNIIAAGSETGSSQTAFVMPGLTADYQTATSALSLDYLDARDVDYDMDGTVDTSSVATRKFDAALATLAEQFNLDGCVDPNKVRVVFEVDFNEGLKDGNCASINRFKWVTDEPGKQMYFVGGIHEDSPEQDAELDRSLGNPSSWQPNTIPMSDDGSNGDAVAGDNIWTIFFDMPRGTRVGYKYTWGKRGDLWTGTEEWPGNQRILEAVDVNGDDFVYRRDNFQDEATNKDKANLNRQGMGVVEWDTDADGDGIPDARERKIDLNNDCVLDDWMTPAGVGPATVDCADIQDQ